MSAATTARVRGAAKAREAHLAYADGRREDYAWLRERQGHTITQAADRMGVTFRTAQRWEAWRKARAS